MYVKTTVLLITMKSCAFYSISDITLYQQETLMNCYRKWTHSVSHFNTCSVSIHYSKTDWAYKLSPRVEKWPIMDLERSVLTGERGKWTKCPVLEKIDWFEKSTKSIYWSLSNRHSRRKLDQYLQRIELAKKTKIELEIFIFVHCILDGHGIYDTHLVCLRMKSSHEPYFAIQRDFKMWSVSVNDIVITAIISSTTEINKKQTPPIFR